MPPPPLWVRTLKSVFSIINSVIYYLSKRLMLKKITEKTTWIESISPDQSFRSRDQFCRKSFSLANWSPMKTHSSGHSAGIDLFKLIKSTQVICNYGSSQMVISVIFYSLNFRLLLEFS